jgi:hypothetical protein
VTRDEGKYLVAYGEPGPLTLLRTLSLLWVVRRHEIEYLIPHATSPLPLDDAQRSDHVGWWRRR